MAFSMRPNMSVSWNFYSYTIPKVIVLIIIISTQLTNWMILKNTASQPMQLFFSVINQTSFWMMNISSHFTFCIYCAIPMRWHICWFFNEWEKLNWSWWLQSTLGVAWWKVSWFGLLNLSMANLSNCWLSHAQKVVSINGQHGYCQWYSLVILQSATICYCTVVIVTS